MEHKDQQVFQVFQVYQENQELQELQDPAGRAVMAAQGLLALVALLSCAMGMRAAGQLLYAFELQAEKKGQAAPAAAAAATPPAIPAGRGRRSKWSLPVLLFSSFLVILIFFFLA